MQRWIPRATLGSTWLWLALSLAASCLTVSSRATVSQAATAQAPAAPADSSGGLVTLGQDLTLAVTEDGPNQPWTVTLANRGSEPLGFIADPGLLWFDVSVAGRAPQTCSLPAPLRPSSMQRKSVLVLRPGEQYSRRLDPRFFCFAELGQLLLVPRAKVTPNFGWPRDPPPSKLKPRAGTARRSTAPALTPSGAASPPFVAWRLSGSAANLPPPSPSPATPTPTQEGPEGKPGSNAAVPAWRMPTEGLKSVQGAALELPDSYVAWVGPARRDPARDIELVLLAGSDAEDERNATVSFGLINTLDRPQQIFVRRELLEYDVQGPDGFFECPSSDVGSPDYASFSTLAPHGAERAVVRLIEVCPRRSFARPGLYEVHARLAAKWSGQELGLDAFVGQIEALRPAFVRVRSGDRSSFARLVVPPAGPGGAPAAEAPAPAEAAPEAPPADEAAGERDNPNDETPPTPDQPAAPEAPPVE